MLNMSLTEKLTYATVLIHCKYADGSMGSGTGFIINLCRDEDAKTCVPVIVTNNHVVENSVNTQFEFCLKDENGNPKDQESFRLEYKNNLWIPHPNKDIDLCCLLLAPALREMELLGKSVFYIPLETSLIPTKKQEEELSAMEDVVMIGYPKGLSDQYNHKPVIRKGITATHPKNDYQGKSQILLDMACFPGSSGSPVFVVNQGSYTVSNGIVVGNRIILLGILFGGPQYNAQGVLTFNNIPKIPRPLVSIPMNLGVAVKSSNLLDFETIFKK